MTPPEPSQREALTALVETGALTMAALSEAWAAAELRQLPLSTLLVREYGVPRPRLLAALAQAYHCQAIEYDERLPVPPELLPHLSAATLSREGWFPVCRDQSGLITIATVDPTAPGLADSVASHLGPGPYEFRVTLADDLQWFIQDYLHARPGELIGTERTGLAYWRNTMAQWRTVLACYRNDMALARTALALVRFGLALVTGAMTLWRAASPRLPRTAAIAILVVGLASSLAGLPTYVRVRRSRLRPPDNQTLMEVTAATLHFLEQYHFPAEVAAACPLPTTGETMLARLSDLLANYCTILFPVPPSRERTHLARERNVLAAQRTIAACYRTIYARARTGLAFTRTGVSFLSLGVGLGVYFGLGVNTLFDTLLAGAGLLMVVDGLLWYLPVRREQAELPRRDFRL